MLAFIDERKLAITGKRLLTIIDHRTGKRMLAINDHRTGKRMLAIIERNECWRSLIAVKRMLAIIDRRTYDYTSTPRMLAIIDRRETNAGDHWPPYLNAYTSTPCKSR